MVVLNPEPKKDSTESKSSEKGKQNKLLLYHFEKASSFRFLRKLPFLSGLWDSHPSKAIAAIMEKSEAIAIAEFVMKKFREISIYNRLEFPLSGKGPFPLSRQEKLGVQLTDDNIHDEAGKNVAITKIQRSFKRKSKLKQECSILPPLNISSPLKSAKTLCLLFRGCINFVRASKFSADEDIDLLLKKVVQNGKVVNIQDHWSKLDYTSRSHWTGALVAYKQPEDSQRILKELFLNRDLSLIPVYVPQHLMLIGHIEARLTPACSGSSILIEGINNRTSREKLSQELGHYGDVLSCKWKSKNHEMFCEVTYPFVVEAVAAALALDGKCVGRNVVKTSIRMGKREKDLHMMVCGHYC
ncbi:hypothetical protein HNY73_017078 [Argiope bruennichi]|uniref:RRM domain-containing protein n=1 Tax=Argiope bruennichi TaxID=94029 RepID=A0A8T0EKQ6_ARGBR|nr:hypothetical protein HNY73_017078 [Argiope bruennichi]